MHAIEIRRARHADIPRLCELLADLFSIEADFHPDRSKQELGLSLLVNDGSGASAVFVVVHDGNVIGMASVQTLISTAEGARSGLVEDVIIDRRFRSKGIGTLLLDYIISWSKEQKLTRLQLLADQHNDAATAFYQCRGWQMTKLQCMRLLLR